MESFLAIVNPAAAHGQAARASAEIIRRLTERGIVQEAVHTTCAGEATEIARRSYAEGRRSFLSVGGDGTTFEILNGLMPASLEGSPVTLAHLPVGTGNSFLRDFDILDPDAAVAALERGESRLVDVVRVEHTAGRFFFLNLLSTGFSATVAALTNRRFKAFGAMGYALAVLGSLAKLPHPVLPVSLDGNEPDRRAGVLLSFSNSRFTGGTMCMAPRADPSDGRLDVIRVGRLGRFRLLATFPSIFNGTHVTKKDVEQETARRVELEPVGRQDVMVDGEVLSVELRSMEVLPRALRVVA